MKVRWSFSMLSWALNEEENIADFILRAEQFLTDLTDDFELILIDDGSTDRTLEIARELQATRPWLHIYPNERNYGSGYNTKRAISLAGKEYLFWQMVDWSYDLSSIRTCIELLAQYDVIQGVRTNIRNLPELLARRSDNPYKALISMVNYVLV